jgi:hypothetical protein
MPPRPRATPAQRERVFRLADEGASLRAIARQVFGAESAKDRVARLLRARPRPTSAYEEIARLRFEIMRENMAAVDRMNAMTREPRSLYGS